APAHPRADHHPGSRRQGHRRVRGPGQLGHRGPVGGPDDRARRLERAAADTGVRRGHAGAARHRTARARRRRAGRAGGRGRPHPGRRAHPLHHPRPGGRRLRRHLRPRLLPGHRPPRGL
ncbi:MAG: hypothetical protein AVDCRST_MAG41-3844, partial [uncultured Corynebacteriales bacterium]